MLYKRLVLLASVVIPLLGDSLKSIAPNAVSDRYRPLAFDQQKLNGLLADRMRINLEGRLLHVDEKALLAGFQQRPGQQEWIGEHAGKYLDAASNTYLYTRDHRLKEQMDRIAKNLIAAQLPDGYLGTYAPAQRWTSWDVWVHKYDLLGVLSYYRVTDDEDALDAANKIGNLLVTTFGDSPGKLDIIKSGEHIGMAATSVLEPMVYLYHYTSDPRYLDFCKYIVRSWDQPNGPKIIASLNSSSSVYKTANAKAYEMLSNLVGLVELYRLTGQTAYLSPAVAAWKDIYERRLYITGTASSAEHFTADNTLPGDEEAKVGEGCVTVTWIQLTLELFRLTGEPQYGEQLERTVYNQLLGAQDAKTGNICYFTPLNGSKSATPGINCCVSSEPRGISLIPSLVWGRYGNGIAVNLYSGGRATFTLKHRTKVQIFAETTYPESGDVLLHVIPDHDSQFPIRLRVPSWTNHFSAEAGNSRLAGKPGEFLTVNRTWRRGDTIKIKMDLTVQVLNGGPTYPSQIAIQRGPQVLALEKSLNPTIRDLAEAVPSSSNPPDLDITDAAAKLPSTWPGNQAYSIHGKYDGKVTDLVLVPFADSKSYRVWMKRPGGSIGPAAD